MNTVWAGISIAMIPCKGGLKADKIADVELYGYPNLDPELLHLFSRDVLSYMMFYPLRSGNDASELHFLWTRRPLKKI